MNAYCLLSASQFCCFRFVFLLARLAFFPRLLGAVGAGGFKVGANAGGATDLSLWITSFSRCTHEILAVSLKSCASIISSYTFILVFEHVRSAVSRAGRGVCFCFSRKACEGDSRILCLRPSPKPGAERLAKASSAEAVGLRGIIRPAVAIVVRAVRALRPAVIVLVAVCCGAAARLVGIICEAIAVVVCAVMAGG